MLDQKRVEYGVVRLEDALRNWIFLYMTHVPEERFFNKGEDYVRMKDFYILDAKKMELAPKSMYVLHPLPRSMRSPSRLTKTP